MTASLCLLVHANSGVGKSWLADTAPGPRLVLDAEGGTKWTKSRKIKWDPRTQPPTGLGPEDTVVVRVLSFQDLQLARQWLDSGKHEFRSVIMDSATEAQYKCMLNIAGARQMETQDWGTLLRDMLGVATAFRDLPDHPTNPVECIIFITGAVTKDGLTQPDLQGQLQRKLPYIVDVVGYMFTAPGSNAGEVRRGMMIQPGQNILAKDRTDVLTKHYGAIIEDPSIPAMMAVMNGEAVA